MSEQKLVNLFVNAYTSKDLKIGSHEKLEREMHACEELAIYREDNAKERWIKKEVSGYGENDKVPQYRKCRNVDVKLSIFRIMRILKKHKDTPYTIKHGGGYVGMGELEDILRWLEKTMFKYIIKVVMEMGIEGFPELEITEEDMENIKEEDEAIDDMFQ